MRRLYPLFLVLLAAWTVCAPASLAHRRAPAPMPKEAWNREIGWVTVPVFYVTDRHLNVQSGEVDFSEEQRTDGLSYGVKNVTIPLTAHLNNYAKQLKEMGWHILSTEGEPHQRYVSSSELQFPDQHSRRKDSSMRNVRKGSAQAVH